MNNREIWEQSLKSPENYVDEYYQKEMVVITKDSSEKNELIRANQELIENITGYKIALENGHEELADTIVNKIKKLLKTKNINYSEFTNYWCVRDVSYSSYCTFDDIEKTAFLKAVLCEYISHRHGMYTSHGYTPTTLQVRCDSIAHKRSGNLGSLKVSKLLAGHGYVKGTGMRYEEFMMLDKVYICPDNGDLSLFDEIISKNYIEFEWRQKHQNKNTDFLIKNGNRIIILEHKHMKEEGGGQNKQISEVIDFIQESEKNPNLSYVTFLDGVYFNNFIYAQGNNKLRDQIRQINQALAKNPNNYFVNTAGFMLLLDNVI